jgi:hypothetical protein
MKLTPKQKKWFNIIRQIAEIVFMLGLIMYFQWLGFAFVMLYWIIFALFMLYKQREQYFFIKHYIETVIWGKPLNMFKKGELKNHKVKIKWRRDKNDILPQKEKRRTERKSKN